MTRGAPGPRLLIQEPRCPSPRVLLNNSASPRGGGGGCLAQGLGGWAWGWVVGTRPWCLPRGGGGLPLRKRGPGNMLSHVSPFSGRGVAGNWGSSDERRATPPRLNSPPSPQVVKATPQRTAGICRLRHDRMERGPTEPHTGRGTFLLSSGGVGGGYY